MASQKPRGPPRSVSAGGPRGAEFWGARLSLLNSTRRSQRKALLPASCVKFVLSPLFLAVRLGGGFYPQGIFGKVWMRFHSYN